MQNSKTKCARKVQKSWEEKKFNVCSVRVMEHLENECNLKSNAKKKKKNKIKTEIKSFLNS